MIWLAVVKVIPHLGMKLYNMMVYGVMALSGRKSTLRRVDSLQSLFSPYRDAGTLHSLQESRCEEVTTPLSAMYVIE